jgi:hypothetical protein
MRPQQDLHQDSTCHLQLPAPNVPIEGSISNQKRITCADPPLAPNEPYNVGGPGTCRVDNATSFMYCPEPTSDGTSPPEQFIPIRPDGTNNLIQPGEPMYWKSVSRDPGAL